MASTELKGKRIVLTKSLREEDEIKAALEQAGAKVIQMPLIEIEGIEDKEAILEVFKSIATYEWIVFTSANGVNHFFQAFFQAFKDIRSFGPARIACVGGQTARAVREYLLDTDLVPEESTSLGLARELVDSGSLPSAYVLWVCGDRANKEAIELLQGKGEAIVDVFEVYRNRTKDLSNDPLAETFRKEGADGVLFASPSAVNSFVEQAEHLARETGAIIPKTVSIGPSTTVAMKQMHIPMDKESASPAAIDVVAAFKALLVKS